MIEYLFGYPCAIVNLKGDTYNKKEIVDTIEKNYNIDNNRNEWGKDTIEKNHLHHLYNDWDNKKFFKVNFNLLTEKYKIIITDFLSKLHFKNSVKFKFNVINYTCMKKNQFMTEHIHPFVDFTLIHYIKFNENIHEPTVFKNTHSHTNFSEFLNTKLMENLDLNFIENSYVCKIFKFNIKEDDICIVPGLIPHYVPISEDNSETRITIVTNVNIL